MRFIEIIIEAVKARIDHPEDLVWQGGAAGAKSAMDALSHLKADPSSTTIKWDGSPALIFGRDPDDGSLVVTDKSGFGAKRYDGFAKSAKHLHDMLVARAPDDPTRADFARKIAGLWSLFERAVPKDLRGFYQGDLLYVGTPPVNSGAYEFKPNKIAYRVPAGSELGKRIGASKAGIVVHGYLADRATSVPEPIDNVKSLQGNPGLLVIPPNQTSVSVPGKIVPPALKNAAAIDDFILNPDIRAQKISDLGALIGTFMNGKAGRGDPDLSAGPREFVDWITTNDKIGPDKARRMVEYIQAHKEGYLALWDAIVKIHAYKSELKRLMDTAENSEVSASLGGESGHEGYVAATPHGKIKLVDRHKFMAKDSE